MMPYFAKTSKSASKPITKLQTKSVYTKEILMCYPMHWLLNQKQAFYHAKEL